ncbi:zinc-ribbon domain-containing protein [Streptosporangium sp. G11]
MMLIFGLRTVAHRLGVATLPCRNCGNTAAQVLSRRVTKFSLFFIPLFPVRTRYEMQCTFCGASYTVSKDEATRLAVR